MKKLLFHVGILLIFASVFTSSISAQMMVNWDNTLSAAPSLVSATIQDEAKGKQIWEQLQSKQVTCEKLKDEDYEVLGEFYMGQSIGNTERHTVMNQMMKNMMGENGEEHMHITFGKRSSGCDTNASFPSGYGFPMMGWMMGGGGNPMMGYGGWNNMMNGWNGFGFLGLMPMLLFWILIIVGVVAFVRYLGGSGKTTRNDKTPVEILKERYAKGEIGKKEFEAIKQDVR